MARRCHGFHVKAHGVCACARVHVLAQESSCQSQEVLWGGRVGLGGVNGVLGWAVRVGGTWLNRAEDRSHSRHWDQGFGGGRWSTVS